MVTISAGVSVVFGVLLGILSVRYDLKKLLLLGVLSVILGTVGCFLAPDFLFMQIFYPIEGIGTIIVSSMALALVDEFLILSKRPKATGWIIAGGPTAGLVSYFAIILFFSSTGGWRSYLLWFALPISLLSLMAVYFGVPFSPHGQQATAERNAYLVSFRQIFLNKSVVGCLLGDLFRATAIGFGSVYSATFFRENFGLPIAGAAPLGVGTLAVYSLGSILGGHLVNRVGRKRQLGVTLVISSPLIALLVFVPNLWIAIALSVVGNFIYSMSNSPSVSLTVEQTPQSRGTIMAMNEIFVTLGLAFGVALGGVALVLSGWIGLLLTFIALGLVAAAIFFFLTKTLAALINRYVG